MNVRHEWVQIRPGLEMSRDALMVDGVRINVTPAQAREWAEKLGGRLPTPAELDARHAAAPVKILPLPGTVSTRTARQHSSDIDTHIALAGVGGIISNVGKQWVDWPMPAGRRALYGWHVETPSSSWRGIPVYPSETLPGVKVIQRPWDSNHNDGHTDYSMTLVLTRATSATTKPTIVAPQQTKPGDKGAAVKAWQSFLNVALAHVTGFTLLKVDGDHGPKTTSATQMWLAMQQPHVTSPKNWTEPAVELRCKNYLVSNRKPGDVLLCVMHSIECPAKNGFARNNARWFNGPKAPMASVQWFVGPDEAIHTLEERHVGFGAKSDARRTANSRGIHIEQTGYAATTDWLREGMPVLLNSSEVTAGVVNRWDLLPRWVDKAGLVRMIAALRAGDTAAAWAERGITSHNTVTEAFGVVGGHRDPGLQGDRRWPIHEFIEMVRERA